MFPTPDWNTVVLSPNWLSRIDRLALLRFGQPGLAEEAATFVIERLSEHNWARCRSYSGQSRPETFLQVLACNLLEEFSRKRFGRPRPPTWLQREGELWVRLWKMVCMERQLVPSVIDQLSGCGQREPSFIHQIITVIKSRMPWCGDSSREIPAACLLEDEVDAVEMGDDSIEQKLDRQQWEDALLLIHQLLLRDASPSNSATTTKNIPASMDEIKAAQLQHQLALSEEERLLLKMVYQDGLKLNLVASALNMPAYQPGRLLNRLHQRIRRVLEDSHTPLGDVFATTAAEG